MIDSYLRSPYQKVLVDPVARRMAHLNPNRITLVGCACGIAVLPLLFLSSYLALAALLFSGYLDTLDGTIARTKGKSSPAGTILDITSDRLVEFAIILALFFVNPAIRGLPCLLMLGATLLCITSFLVVGIFSENQSSKSFHYSPGLIERSEAFLFFAAMILFPSIFTLLSTAFTLLVFTTAFIRVVQFSRQMVELFPHGRDD